MIVFKCSNCGVVLRSDEAHAGHRALCSGCHAEIVLPAQSDPDCLLIFVEDGDSSGTPMTVAELQAGLSEGRITPDALLWKDGRWIPLSDEYELEEPTYQTHTDLPELAVYFTQLRALPGLLESHSL